MVEALLKGVALGLLLSISVGPVLFSVIKQSLNNGHRGGLAFVAGVSFSDIALVTASNFFTEFFGSISEHKKPIGITGSLFLIAVGIYFTFFKKISVNAEGKITHTKKSSDYIKIFLTGFFMNTLNPSVILFWLTTSTSFITLTLWNRFIIFSTCLGVVLSADIAKVMMAGKIRNKLTPHNIHMINRINGLILMAFGIILILGLLFYTNKLK
ncbi:MAG TPA: LysE family transporter [Chitinophagaceae bacterium]|nr:LysE family transporter [Chitinophagaceae bacterium]